MAQPSAVPYDGRIAAKVKELVLAGVPRSQIHGAIQKYQNAPRSMTTFYKLYRDDMDEVQGGLIARIGSKVIKQAEEGDFKSQQFYLETQGGWNKKDIHVNVDVDGTQVDEGALEKLMGALGKLKNEEPEETQTPQQGPEGPTG